jgi:ABC-type polysaccharide/polyol phosphate export permease
MIKKIINDIKKYWNYSIVAAKAQLESEVANSYLNWVWWVLEPFCMMLIYAFIFGKVFGMKEDNYSVFIFLGLSLYDFFSKCLKSSIKIVKRNKQIITKVYIPKFILIISDMYVSGFKMLMCLIVTFIMMIVTKVPITWHIIYLIPILIDLFIVTFACCTFLSHFGVFIEDLSNVINIVLRFLFYFTGIFYSIKTKFPMPYSKIVLRCYPIAKLIDYARETCLYGNNVNIMYLIALFVISLIIAIIGIRVIYKNENTYVKMI